MNRFALAFFLLSPMLLASPRALAGDELLNPHNGSGIPVTGPTTTTSTPAAMTEQQSRACLLAGSGRLAINSIYGNCNAAQAVKGNPTTQDPLCNAPTTFVTDSLDRLWMKRSTSRSCWYDHADKPSYSQDPPRVSIDGGHGSNHIMINPAPKGRTDCSGIVSAIYLRSGMNLVPSNSLGQISSTEEMVKFDKTNSCFDVPKLDPVNSILPGDVVVVNNGETGHVWMIDRVGEKPFGDNPCGSFSPETWDFTIIESSGSKGFKTDAEKDADAHPGDGATAAPDQPATPANSPAPYNGPKRGSGAGVHMMTASAHAGKGGTNSKIYEAYRTIWESMCSGGSAQNTPEQPAARLLRHLGNAKSGCMHDASNLGFTNEACVKDCELGGGAE